MRSVFWLLGAALCTSLAGSAQTAPVSLQGKVIDQTGAAVPGAVVVIVDTAGKRFSMTTGGDGRFGLQDAPGVYETTVNCGGFVPVDSQMTYSGNATAIITLRVGQGGGVQTSGPETVLPTSPAAVQGRIEDHPTSRSWEYGALFQGGVGLTDNRDGFRFLLAGVHAGKVLTPELGTGLLRGNFEYAVELFPYFESLTPTFPRIQCGTVSPLNNVVACSAPYTVGGTAHGVSVTPIILRWNLTHGTRLMPYLQGAGGVVWTNHKFPAYGNTNPQDVNETGPNSDTSVWNFTPQFGVGAHYFLKPRRSVDLGANAVHISSASLGDRNPGINASVQFSVGYTWWK